MRKILNFNYKWAFTKQATEIPTEIHKDWNFVKREIEKNILSLTPSLLTASTKAS